MSIFWDDQTRSTNKTFFHPTSSMNQVQKKIYHLLHCEGHYAGKVVDSKLVIQCAGCQYETTEINEAIVRSVTFAPIDTNILGSN